MIALILLSIGAVSVRILLGPIPLVPAHVLYSKPSTPSELLLGLVSGSVNLSAISRSSGANLDRNFLWFHSQKRQFRPHFQIGISDEANINHAHMDA